MTTSEIGGRCLYREMLDAFQSKSATVGVIGLGYVGLPLCLAFAEAGVRVIGFDIDTAKADLLMRGESYLRQFPSTRIVALRSAERFWATSDMSQLNEPDAILICVPTPLTRHLEPDLNYVTATAETIARHVRRGQLIILESTTYPGTTAEVLKPILETSGLKVGQDIWLAYSPEREDPGNEVYSTDRIPKVVGADDEESRALAVALYRSFASQLVPVSKSAAAEAVKITENIFRAVKIALVNELKMVLRRMDIDIWEVINAAKTKPFGFMPFYPGPGLGGHCIPIDPFYLTWKAKEFGLSTRFIELAGQINAYMPDYVVTELATALDMRFRKPLNGSRILMIGVAYKKNVADVRESPGLRLMDILESRGAAVEYHDPLVPVIPATRAHARLTDRASVPLTALSLGTVDAVLIATDHDDVDYQLVAETAPLIVDTRNACGRHAVLLDKVVSA